MILIELKDYLKRVKAANLAQLCQQFRAEPEFTRLLLAQWMAKGKVRKAEKLPGCGTSCAKCPSEMTEVYEWIG